MRFFKPSATEYQSQFSPLNLDFMQKNLAQKEANDLVAEDLIDKASQLKIKGGNYTKDEEIKKYQDWIDTNTAAIKDKFYSGELDAKEAARNLGKISQFYNTNEVIKRMNNDYVYSQNQNKNLVEGKLNKAVGTNFNYLGQTPTWDKVNMSEITDDQHAALYNTIAPTSMYDKENYLEQFRDMKAKVSGTSFAGNASLDYSTGVPLIMNSDRKTVNSELTRTMVREIAAQMAPQEISNAATPWVQYNQNRYKGQYNEDNFVDDFENAFTGYVDTHTSDTNKHFSQVSGSGNSKTSETPGGAAYAAAAKPTQKGIENTKTFKDRFTSFLSTTPIVIDPLTGAVIPPEQVKQLKTYGLPVPKAQFLNSENISQEDRKLISHYFKLKANQTGNKYFETLADNIIKGKNIDFLKSDNFYKNSKKTGFYKKEFIEEITNPKFLERMSQVDVRSNNVVEDLPYDAPEFYAEAGIRNAANSPANLEDFLASALATQSKIYDVESGEVIQPGKIKDKYKDMDPASRASTRVGITLYRPENNFSVSIGDGDSWANSYQVSIGGSPFVVQTGRHQDPVRKQREYDNEMINKIHTTLSLGMPGEILHWGKGDWVYDDSDKENPKYVELKSNAALNTPVEVYQWGLKNR